MKAARYVSVLLRHLSDDTSLLLFVLMPFVKPVTYTCFLVKMYVRWKGFKRKTLRIVFSNTKLLNSGRDFLIFPCFFRYVKLCLSHGLSVYILMLVYCFSCPKKETAKDRLYQKLSGQHLHYTSESNEWISLKIRVSH